MRNQEYYTEGKSGTEEHVETEDLSSSVWENFLRMLLEEELLWRQDERCSGLIFPLSGSTAGHYFTREQAALFCSSKLIDFMKEKDSCRIAAQAISCI